jgi:ribosome-binding factor A
LSSNRLEKVNSLLAREISNLLARDFDFHGALVTVTRVEATANLIEAKAYVSVLPEDKTAPALKALNHNVFDLQQKINKKLNMRPIPKIKFVQDRQIASAANIEALLANIKDNQNE